MKIQVFGSGCAKCKNLHKAVEQVLEKMGLQIAVEYSTDIAKMAEIGAMASPIFVINGEIVSAGKLPSHEEIENAILGKTNEETTECCGQCSGKCC